MMKRLILDIQAWQRETFPESSLEAAYKHLSEEVLEEMDGAEDPDEAADVVFLLAQYAALKRWDMASLIAWSVIVDVPDTTLEWMQDYIKSNDGFDPASFSKFHFVLGMYAYSRGFELYDEVEKKFNVNKARNWPDKPDEFGVYYHEKDAASV
jgi:hypothetical protein